MASATTIATFIERIAPCAQNSFQKLGKVKPSICIAMDARSLHTEPQEAASTILS